MFTCQWLCACPGRNAADRRAVEPQTHGLDPLTRTNFVEATEVATEFEIDLMRVWLLDRSVLCKPLPRRERSHRVPNAEPVVIPAKHSVESPQKSVSSR